MQFLKAAACLQSFSNSARSTYAPASPALGPRRQHLQGQGQFFRTGQKVRHAGAVVVGGYSPYGAVDGFTKAFLERLFSLRHQNGLNKGKLAVVVATGIGRGAPGLEEASNQIAHALNLEGMNVLGRLKVTGNPECMVCGYGQSCPMSALPWIFGDDTTVTPEKFCNVEDQTETWEQAKALGQEITRKLGDLMRM